MLIDADGVSVSDVCALSVCDSVSIGAILTVNYLHQQFIKQMAKAASSPSSRNPHVIQCFLGSSWSRTSIRSVVFAQPTRVTNRQQARRQEMKWGGCFFVKKVDLTPTK